MGVCSLVNCASNWFECLSAKAPALRLYCFPYAGGSPDIYRGWRRWFPENVEICLVYLPGRRTGVVDQAFTRLLPLIKELADRIDRESKIPYAFFGHSMGALITFELGRELFRRHGTGPEHLFVSGRRAPQYPSAEPPTFNLPKNAFLSELARLNGTPKEVLDNPELIEFFLDILRADFELVETYEYRPGKPLPCPITVYGGLDDKDVSIKSCHAWQRQTSASCTVRMFKGDHFFVRNPGPELIAAFKKDLLSAISDLTKGN